MALAILRLIILLCCLTIANSQFRKIPFSDRAEQLSRRLGESDLGTLRETHQLTKIGIDKLEEIKLNKPYVEYGMANASQVAHEIAERLTKFFANRVESLLAAVREAEDIVQNHSTVTKIENVDTYFGLRMKDFTWKVPENMTMLPEFRTEVFEPASTVYITRDVYYKVAPVVNGIAWTNKLDRIWKENREKRNITGWQYFGSRHGFIRTYPGQVWSQMEGEENNNYNPAYDIRRFPWYQQGVTSPKDVLILFDTSGSVYGQALQYMKIAAFNFIETLNENDFVNVMTFNKQAQLITPQINSLVPASERNKKMLKRYLDNIVPLNEAGYSTAFQSAFEFFDGQLGNSSEFQNGGFGAACNQIILLLTDGGSEFPEEVFRSMNWNRRLQHTVREFAREMNLSLMDAGEALHYASAKRRIFAYALGQQQNPVFGLRQIACTNRGYFKHVLDIGAIKSVIEKYVEVLQRPMLQNMETHVTFSGRYYEQDGMGYVVSVLAPVFDRITDGKSHTVSSQASVLGLMANDISLVQIMNETIEPMSRKLGTSGYVFVINQNGFAITHPLLHAMDDLTVLSAGNIKDRQVNDGVDILDLEFDDEARQEIRRRMIDGESGNVTLHDVLMRCTHNDTAIFRTSVTYAFAPVSGTPFSVGVVVPHRGSVRRSTTFAPDPESASETVTAQQYEDALGRLLQVAADALQPTVESTNRNVTVLQRSMAIPTQVYYCKSLPITLWTPKTLDSAAEPVPTSGPVSQEDEQNATGTLEVMLDRSDVIPSFGLRDGDDHDKPFKPTTDIQYTDNTAEGDDAQLSNPDAGEGDAESGSGDSSPHGRDEDALAFIRYIYAYFDAFSEKVRNGSRSVGEFSADCGTPTTFQLLVDALVMLPIMNEWMSPRVLADVDNGTLPTVSEGVISKLLISANALSAGYPKARFDDYMTKGFFSPQAHHNSLYETAIFAESAVATSKVGGEGFIHFEVLRAANEPPRLFAITPLSVPVDELAVSATGQNTATAFAYILGIAAVEVNTSYFNQLLDSAVPECDGEALCYLIDEFGYVIASSALASEAASQLLGGRAPPSVNSTNASITVGTTLLDANAPLFLALLHDGAFIRTNFYFTQEKCDSPSQVIGATAGGNSPFSFAFWSRLLSAVSMHVSQLLTTSFWTDSFFSLFSDSSYFSFYADVADAAGPQKGGRRKGGRKGKKRGGASQQQTEEEDERRCTLNVTRFVLNRTVLERDERDRLRAFGTFRCDASCEKGYAIVPLPDTSLFLLMTASSFTCSLVRHSHSHSHSHSEVSPNESVSESKSETFGNASFTVADMNYTVNSYDANCNTVNGMPDNSILQLDHEHAESETQLEGGFRLETEVRLGDGEYADRMRKRYRRRPSVCYDFWIEEDPTCRAAGLFFPIAAFALSQLLRLLAQAVRSASID